MSSKTERIQYLTRKAEKGSISASEKRELATLLGKNPKDYSNEESLSALVGIALVFIALALLSQLMKGGKK